MFQWTSSEFFFNFRFSSRKCQTQQKLPKNIAHFTNLSSLDIENNKLAQHCQKHLWLYKFSSKHVSVWCQKRYLHTVFLDTQELHSWSTLKGNVCIFLYVSFFIFPYLLIFLYIPYYVQGPLSVLNDKETVYTVWCYSIPGLKLTTI